MTGSEQAEREAVVAEALSWVRTPYHHMGRVKGAGVDCAMLLIEVYHSAGLIPDINPEPYPQDWALHRSEEKYLAWVNRYAHEVEAPSPGDLVLYKFGRCVSHGGIVVDWPRIIHAYVGEGCVYADGEKGMLSGRFAGFYSLWGK